MIQSAPVMIAFVVSVGAALAAPGRTPALTEKVGRMAHPSWVLRAQSQERIRPRHFQHPQLLRRTAPSYTPEALAAGVQGSVVLEAVIEPDGTAQDLQIVKSLGFGLDDQAREEIAGNWLFRPALLGGRPVPAPARIEVDFRLSRQSERAQPQEYPSLTEALGEGSSAASFERARAGPDSSRDAVLLRRTEPSYTQAAIEAGVEGAVVLEVVVRRDGTAASPRLVKRLGFGLDEKALEEIVHWRFLPALREGRPVESRVTIEVTFSR